MITLPKYLLNYLIWIIYKVPRHLLVVGARFLVLINNQLSFTRNIRLLFTPLFGDYTLIGRFIGFCTRTGFIVAGLIFISTLSLCILLLPILWFYFWLAMYLEVPFISLGLMILLAICYFLITRKQPQKRVKQVKFKEDFISCFQADTLECLNLLDKNKQRGVQDMCLSPKIITLFKRCEIEDKDFVEKLKNNADINKEKLVEYSFQLAQENKSRYVELEHLFIALLRSINKFELFLANYHSNIKSWEEVAKWQVNNREILAKMFIWQPDYELLYVGGFGKGMTGRITPYLDSIASDFTKLARDGRLKHVVGREAEIEKIAKLLEGNKDNILIIGEPGSGKTSIIRGIAHKIMEGTQFKALNNKRLVSLEIGSLLAGVRTSGELAANLKKILDEVEGSANIILFIDEIHNLVAGTGDRRAETSTIYTILEPKLAEGKIQFIGATNITNYRKYIEPNGAFTRLFQIVEIQQASYEDTMNILKEKARDLERKSNIFITYSALETTVKLSEKLIHERVLPDKALDILGRTVSRVSLVTSQEIEKEIAEMTHIPMETLDEDETTKLLNIETEMKKSVIGQDTAIVQISKALKRARTGIRNEKKPIASFLFVGTTGIGKTQTAKALSKSYFGSTEYMIRLDMSEYQQVDSINKLIGSPQKESTGLLTENVRTKPFTLILLDEIEKAHSSVLLTFLQVLDEGRLTDSQGRTIDFTNTIIIATSNVGTRSIQEIFNRNGTKEEMDTAALKNVREKFAPEFLNRFNGIIVFNPLSTEDIRKITVLLLDRVKNNAQERGISLTFSEELLSKLVSQGYNPEWGARPMARLIEDTVESYLAQKILEKSLKSGDELTLGVEVFTTDTQPSTI